MARSFLGSEMHDFFDALDSGYVLRHDLSNILQTKIMLNIITDLESLFRVIAQYSTTNNKRLIINFLACREAYYKRSIDNAGWVWSENNVADVHSKEDKADSIKRVMGTWSLSIISDQWIVGQMKVTWQETRSQVTWYLLCRSFLFRSSLLYLFFYLYCLSLFCLSAISYFIFLYYCCSVFHIFFI